MLDTRHKTFLMLCRIGSYTKTAQALFITQPAVSQHIKYLEQQYGGKLFYYEGKVLCRTPRAQSLYAFVQTMYADSDRLQHTLQEEAGGSPSLSFGATLSIGEFLCPRLLTEQLRQTPELKISLHVENTQHLLCRLSQGEIGFALVEGFFDRALYANRLFSREPFVAVCGANHPLAGKKVALSALQEHRLIVRESGSGTREVLEHALRGENVTMDSFRHVCEIGSLHAIKMMVAENLGVTFLYRMAAQKELAQGSLQEIRIEGFSPEHAFYFVYLKGSLHEAQYLNWYTQLQRLAAH